MNVSEITEMGTTVFANANTCLCYCVHRFNDRVGMSKMYSDQTGLGKEKNDEVFFT